MTDRGEALGVAPVACPFVALELDRDRRSDKPDYRHRCFAEPTPQPRAISHQASYCLSPNFAACPIFQDWAVRASAQPMATAGSAAVSAVATDVGPEVAPAMAAAPLAAAPLAAAPLSADIQPELPAPGEDWPADAFASPQEPEAAEQLSVFATAAAEQPAPPLMPAEPGRYEPARDPYSTAAVEPSMSIDPDEAAVPGFLAGRPPRPARSSRPDESLEKVTREDLIPSWERDGRFGAEPAEREKTDRMGGIITAIAVVAILALGVAGVIFLPALLAGGGPARTATPMPSVAPSGGVLPSAIVTPVATVTPSPTPDISAGPSPTPHIYRVRKGDSVAGIARKFHISSDELLAANPQVTNPNHIEPGDLLTIPPPGGSLPTAAP